MSTPSLSASEARGKNWINLSPVVGSQRSKFIKGAVDNDIPQHILVYNILDYFLFKELFGIQVVEMIERLFAATMEEECENLFSTAEKPHGFFLDQGEYVLSWPNDVANTNAIPENAFTLKAIIQKKLDNKIIQETGQRVRIGIGHFVFEHCRDATKEQAFFHAISQARLTAKQNLNLESLSVCSEFSKIISGKNITTLYQAIIDFSSSSVFGWEALSRGPAESSLFSPVALFDAAETLGRLFELEKVCRESAIDNFSSKHSDKKLFLNIHPRTVVDPGFTPGKTLEAIEKLGLSPANVVFEITERHSIKDFELFHRTLGHYRSQGFQVAIDDVGTGYSGLSTIAEIRPDYMKIDMSLVRNIHHNPVKRAIMETTVAFADKIGTKVIAEGIEKPKEACCLMDMGVHFGQGFFFSRPEREKCTVCMDLTTIRPQNTETTIKLACSMPIGKLVEKVTTLDKDTSVSLVKPHFEQETPISSVVVVENDKPVGIVMSYHLDKQLATQYGLALYYNRPVTHVMDPAHLSVDEACPVEKVAQKAMARDKLKAYDDIIVTSKGVVIGIVSVQKLMDTLAHLQLEVAKGVNPLTGLKGNVALEKEVEQKIDTGQQFNLIYADLDHFKVYNDTYGFKNGDAIIKLTAKVLSWGVKKYGGSGADIFHIGGDDFVLTTNPDTSERMCRGIIRCFKRLVKGCYCTEDVMRGWIRAKGRDGQEKDFPLVSISLGAIFIKNKCSLMEIGERAAHIKKYAKSFVGNSYVHDRRLPLGEKGPIYRTR